MPIRAVGPAAHGPARAEAVRHPAAARRRLACLIGIVLLAPLPIGAVEPWAWGGLSIAVALLLAAHACCLLRGERPAVPLRRVRLPLLCFALALVWAMVQASSATPAQWHHPLWAAAGAALGSALPGSISINPAETVDAMIRLATYAAVYYLALNFCRDGRNADRALRSIALGAAAYAAYGIAAHLSGAETILWLAKTSYLGDLTGTFVNRNSYATFAGLGLIAAAALLLRGVRRAGHGTLLPQESRRRLGEYLTTHGAVPAGAMLLIATSLLLSHSRAGLASTIIALLTFALLTGLSRRAAIGRTIRLLLLGAIPALCVLALAGGGTLLRLLDAGDDAALRLRLLERTLTAAADAPLLGTGPGTFQDIFQIHRTADIRDPQDHAHNSYLESALELGLPAAGLLLAAAAGPALLCARGLRRRRRDRTYPCLGLAATMLVGLHAAVDFSLQIPAVAALYALLMGVAGAQSWSSRAVTSA